MIIIIITITLFRDYFFVTRSTLTLVPSANAAFTPDTILPGYKLYRLSPYCILYIGDRIVVTAMCIHLYVDTSARRGLVDGYVSGVNTALVFRCSVSLSFIALPASRRLLIIRNIVLETK